MEINSTNLGIQSFLNATQRVEESAVQIAKSSTGDTSVNLTNALVDLKVAEREAGVAAKIIEVENAQVGTIMDLIL
jgi:hypothetical protein